MNSREVLLFVAFSPLYEPYHSSDGKKDPAYSRTRTVKRQVASCPQKGEHQDQKKPFLVMPDGGEYYLKQKQRAEVGDIAEVAGTHFRHYQHHAGYCRDRQQSENPRFKFHARLSCRRVTR